MGIKRLVAERFASMLAMVLPLGGGGAYRAFVQLLWERTRSDPIQGLDLSLHCPDPVDPDPADRTLVARIFAAYERASRDQRGAPPVFQPSTMWQSTLRRAYAELSESLPDRDLDRFHRFLANFGVWDESTGIEESRLLWRSARGESPPWHLQEKIVGPLVQWWLRLESHGRDLSALEIPRHGNLGGVLVDGHLISPGTVFGDVHARLVAGFVDVERPVIAELGGGFGRLAYLLSRHLGAFRYVGFDLPETLCCASYYLMKSFPEKRFLLYGEEARPAERLGDYDVILLPAFALPTLPDASFDLFLNENSLGEMTAAACRNYVTEMCRTAGTIWHRNHEARRLTFADGTTSLLNREYPFPPAFEQVVRYSDVAPWVRADRPGGDGDMVWYLYRARRPARRPVSGAGTGSAFGALTVQRPRNRSGP